MKSVTMVSALLSVFVGIAAAQAVAPPAFEVASIKLDETGGNYVEAANGTVMAHSATLATCIQWAYGVQGSQVAGADSAVSGMLTADRYTILAKAAGPVPERQLRVMFQTLLAERFKLSLHMQSRDRNGFALVVEKGGPKFKASEGDGESKQQASSKLTRAWVWTTMAQLSDNLAEAMQAPVKDETGLPGKYDFSLDLTPYLSTTGERLDIGAMMVTAVREQLGLRLESRRVAVDVLVIDHLEKPTAN
jgi:uncharacterized protein (TIGR03435 family)